MEVIIFVVLMRWLLFGGVYRGIVGWVGGGGGLVMIGRRFMGLIW